MADIEIKRIQRQEVRIHIVGTAPLVVSKFSEKAKEIMRGSQTGQKRLKQRRDPESDFAGARHRIDGDSGWDGFPATGLKGAIVGGARFFNDKKLNMTLLKQSIFVLGDGKDMLIPILGPDGKPYGVGKNQPEMHEGMVRNRTGVADFRFRPMYYPWSMKLSIIYMPDLMSLETLVALVDAGGFVGIGEWRPGSKESQTGSWGTFQVDDTQEVELVKAPKGGEKNGSSSRTSTPRRARHAAGK
jgi:glutaredoxin-related protein